MNVVLEKPCGEAVSILKAFHRKRIIESPEIQRIQFKGQRIIMELFDAFNFDAEALLPKPTKSLWMAAKNEKDRHRVISDYISGMTNNYAEKMYQTLFTQTKGSIFQP